MELDEWGDGEYPGGIEGGELMIRNLYMKNKIVYARTATYT